MEENRKPRARAKKIVDSGKGVEKYGEGLGIGPVNNTGSYEDRKQQHQQAAQPQRPTGAQPPRQPLTGTARQTQGQSMPPFGGTRPTQGQSMPPFGGARPTQEQRSTSSTRPPVTGGGQRVGGSTGSSTRPPVTGGGQRVGGTGSGTPQRSGGGMKLIGIVVVLLMLLGGGKLTGLFGGDSSTTLPVSTNVTTGTSTGSTHTASGTSTTASGTTASTSGGLSDLLSMLMGSDSSVYDTIGSDLAGFTGITGSTGSGSTSSTTGSSGSVSTGTGSSFATGSSNTASSAVSPKARAKYTKILGGGKDEVTILVYMCGSDLESQNGMATADLKEMANANTGDGVNLLVYTGGASRWQNNVVSAKTNQIYQIKNGSLTRLEADLGSKSMTDPATLASFIQYGQQHFPANRMALIFWDHGGGSVSGYGYDEKSGRGRSMTLAGINEALTKGDVRFDFIGFDACLMATVENGLMLNDHADYMIASEETEPGVGWYYTNWLQALSRNTSMSTVEIGQRIADDFVDVCARKCRGQATTLSVTDLAELSATVPAELKDFSVETNDLIQSGKYQTVSKARARTREFAQQNRIDQIDLVHFARNLGTKEGRELADALQGAVKYNRTGGGVTDAYGLSIYFPYKRTSKVTEAVSAYAQIGMDEEYMRCIQEFASLELSGQAAGSTYGGGGSASLLESLFGGSFSSGSTGSGSYSSGSSGGYGNGSAFSGSYGSSAYTQDGLNDMLGSLFGGSGSSFTGSDSGYGSGLTGSILDLFMGRSMTAERAATYILENHFDSSILVWQNGRISIPEDQWAQVSAVTRNIFYDDGAGYIDLGLDPDYVTEGNDLLAAFDGTVLSINRQPVAYYLLNTEEDGEDYLITGYVPAILNGIRVNLLLAFDQDQPYGYIMGAQKVYDETENATQPKNMIQIGKGDEIQFLCEYYDYQQNYQDTYRLGQPMTLGDTVEIANTPVDKSKCRVTYCFTDWYQQNYWTSPEP